MCDVSGHSLRLGAKASDKFGAHVRSDINVLLSEVILIELDCALV